MDDILIALLMVAALLLFIWSRLQLNKTKNSMTAHKYSEELHHRVAKGKAEGKTKNEIIEVLKKDYGLDQREAEYIYYRTTEIEKENS